MTKAIGLALTGGLALAGREWVLQRGEADLSGQTALIVDGSRGLGLAIARELAQQQCRLALCARDADELNTAAQELREMGAEVLTVVCDAGVEAEVAAMATEVLQRFGQIDLLFTVAGEIQVGQITDLTADDFQRAMDVMFWGTLYPILAVLPGMRARGSGRIAAITSIGGKISVPKLLSYSSAKFAAVGLTEGLATELAAEGIHVTTVVPGLMRTGAHVQAQVKGPGEQRKADYVLFSLGATTPVTPPADRAARTIVRAVKRGQVEVIFPWPFWLASRFHGLAPSTTIRVLRVVNALLPDEETRRQDPPTERGGEVEERIDSSAHQFATQLGEQAVETFNQKSDPPP